ncbi:MAG: PilZ domain-containing protein [Planctomycetaceae bacterium]|nr:PilZ domain-containing protein [Planctomycetaceae bacterium]
MKTAASLPSMAAAIVPVDRRTRPRQDIPAAVVPIGHSGQSAKLVTARILNLSVAGAKLSCDAPLDADRIWLAFTTERRMTLEAEIIWSDFATKGPHEVVYGVSFTRMLSEAEFTRLVETLTAQGQQPHEVAPSAREREESLFSLFRGHSPQGAKPRNTI